MVAASGTTSQPSTPAGKSALTPEMLALKQNPKVQAMEKLVAGINAKPINVYGKVIDQFGQPVVDAKVNGATLLLMGFDHSGGESFPTTTDSEGRFSFTGLHGARFGLDIEKAGYKYDTQLYVNWWNNYKPDPDNPAIFHMWKLQGAEPLVHTSIQAGLSCNGSPRNFDVLAGLRDAGDLVVTLTRNPVNIDRSKPFDWTLTFGIANGGLIEITDLYPNEAPAGGYQPSVAINMPADAKNWTPSVVKSYYIYDGKNYGRITINIMADYQPPPTHFEIDSYVNPVPGDRNLEFDPAQAIKP